MPTLHWIGKEHVLNHHRDVPFKVLDHSYSYNGDTQHQEHTASPSGGGNKIIHGDNLEALKALLPEYEGKITCIYIDPPYNTGNEGWIYNDNVNAPKIKKWLGQVVGKESEDLSRHDKWLCMMYPRLKLLHKLLAEDGFIFVSIDYNSDYLLRILMNEIFGGSNFRNVISVRRGIKNVQAQFEDVSALSVGHEFIYLYSKRPETRLPKLSKQLENEKAGKWDTFWRGTDRPTMRYELFGNKPEKGQWRWEEGRAKAAANNYRIYQEVFAPNMTIDDYFLEHLQTTNEKIDFLRINEESVIQYYVPPQSFKLLSDNWMDILLSGSVTTFDTEKNTLLLDRIVGWITGNSSNALILDSFAGSGTTAHAVLNLNKQDGGNRKFILIEMEEYAESITAERVKRVIQGYGTTEGSGGAFDFYTIGAPMFDEDGNLNESVGVERIRGYVWYTETKTPLGVDLGTGADNAAFLGKHNDTAYYFHYEADGITTLSHMFLATVRTKAEEYVIYADNCLLPQEALAARKIIFKKIPRDITRF